MSLNYVPPNAPFLITSNGVIFGVNSIYNTPLSSKLEFLKIFKASFYQYQKYKPYSYYI